MTVDSRLLIKQIEARPALWNRNDKDYCHKQVNSKLWAEIAFVHNVHESRVKGRWKALRDTFRQELKKNPHQSAWSYFHDMQFLKGQLKTLIVAPTKLGFDEDSEEMTFVKTELEDSSYDDGPLGAEGEDQGPGRGPGPASASLLDEPVSSPEGRAPYDVDDDDYHFLLSLLPEMRKLQPKQKFPLRIKMMEMVYKEAYDHQRF